MDTGATQPLRMDNKKLRLLVRLLRVAERDCMQAGLSLPQYRAMAHVGYGSRRAAELAAVSAVSRPAITVLVGALVDLGYVNREPVSSGDRRRVRLSLTAAGHEKLEAVEDHMAQQLVDLFGDDSSLRKFCSELARLETALDEDLETDLREPGR